MVSLGENWLLKNTRVYHACGPELLHHWTGSRVCDCGIVVPQRVRAFQRWLRKQELRDLRKPLVEAATGDPQPRPIRNWRW